METVVRPDQIRSSVRGALLAQGLAYVVLILAAVVPAALGVGAMAAPVVCATVVMVLMHVFWPFRAGQLSRWFSLLFGIASMLFAFSPLPRLIGLDRPRATGAEGDAAASGMWEYPWVTWAVAAGGLLIVLVIVSFGRQMARAERTHLIRALSHSVTSGTAAIAVAGWCFLPELMRMGVYASAGKLSAAAACGVWVGLAVVVVLAVALAFASVPWVREADPDPASRLPWLGIGLLPVMFLGVVIAAAVLVLTPFAAV